MEQYQWLANQGIAIVVVAFTGFILYRVLVGSKATGYQGLLIRWANGLHANLEAHARESHDEFGKASVQHVSQIDALQLLVESQSPPIGAAFIAAKAVHRTAENVEQFRAASVKQIAIMRLLATQFPDVEKQIDQHCDEIERIIGEA